MAAAAVAVLWKVVVLLWCDHDHELRSMDMLQQRHNMQQVGVKDLSTCFSQDKLVGPVFKVIARQ
jgi:hypothetical protein